MSLVLQAQILQTVHSKSKSRALSLLERIYHPNHLLTLANSTTSRLDPALTITNAQNESSALGSVLVISEILLSIVPVIGACVKLGDVIDIYNQRLKNKIQNASTKEKKKIVLQVQLEKQQIELSQEKLRKRDNARVELEALTMYLKNEELKAKVNFTFSITSYFP